MYDWVLGLSFSKMSTSISLRRFNAIFFFFDERTYVLQTEWKESGVVDYDMKLKAQVDIRKLK